MKHPITFTLLFFFCSVNFHSVLQAETLIASDTFGEKNESSIEITTPFSRIPVVGYIPVTAEVKNKTDLDRSWKLKFTSSPNNYSLRGDKTGMRTTVTVETKKKSNHQQQFLVPITPGFQSTWSHKSLSVEAGLLDGTHSDQLDSPWPYLLISKELHTANGSRLNNAVNKLKPHSGTSTNFEAPFEPNSLLDDWRAYIGYEIIMMTDRDWRDSSPGAQNAIRQWIIMGGRLMMYATESSTTFSSLKLGIVRDPARPETIAATKYSWQSEVLGMGEVQLTPLSGTKLEIDENETVDKIQSNNFYQVSSQSYHDDFSKKWGLQNTFGKRSFSIGLIVFAMLLFGIVIGPVNLFVFAKNGKRHKLFLTTPLISAIASLIFITVIIFQDGFGGQGVRLAIIELGSESDNNVYIHQEQICRTGVLLSSTFTIDEPVFITPVSLAASRWSRFTNGRNGNSNFSMQLEGESATLSGDWFKSRSEHAHVLATVRPTRGKIDFDTSGPLPKATSSLTYPVSDLVFKNTNGDFFYTKSLPNSETVTLQKIDQKQYDDLAKKIKSDFSKRNSDRLQRLTSRSNSFFAHTENAEPISSLDSIRWKNTRSIITGTSK